MALAIIILGFIAVYFVFRQWNNSEPKNNKEKGE